MKVEIPGYKELNLEYLVLDYNGTIAVDGMIPQSVKERLEILAKEFQIYVVTADTHGNARKSCEGLPVEIYTFPSSDAAGSKKKIVEELGGEKIDIIRWSEDINEFISAALSPAKVVKVELLPGETKSCRVTVPDHQLSLAIGNKGQNARLCARLTGYNIDIRPESGYYGEEE